MRVINCYKHGRVTWGYMIGINCFRYGRVTWGYMRVINIYRMVG